MEITKKNQTIFVSSGLIVITTTLLVLGLDILKDNPIPSKKGDICAFPCSFYFTTGMALLAISLPLNSITSFFLSSILSETESKEANKINRIYKISLIIWVINLVGILLFLATFEFFIFNRLFNLGFLTLIGYFISVILFYLFDKWLPIKK